jgi:glycosyltransferase involved in cell wall biosynthesis
LGASQTVAEPLVSIIIPTRNSARTIGALLDSINKQTYPRIETIVVANANSTDATAQIARDHKATVIVNQSLAKDTRMENKNIGAKRANGDYFYFVDSDMELPPTVIEQCVRLCEGGADALTLPEVSIGDGFWTKCRRLEKQLSLDEPYKVACRFMKREVYSSVGGFDEGSTFGEDIDLHIRVLRKGYDVRLPRGIVVYHREEESFTRIFVKTFNYGKSAPRYVRRNPKESLSRALIFRPQWIRHYRLFLSQPLTTVGTLFMIFMKYVATISAMAYSSPRVVLTPNRRKEVAG